VKILGRQPFPALKNYLARCRALIFPGEEDFGIVPVEAMASGRPVIAYGRGGACETVRPGISGMLFNEQSIEALMNAIEQFEVISNQFDPLAIRTLAMAFDESVFQSRMRAFIDHASALHWARPAPMELPSGALLAGAAASYDPVLGQEAVSLGRQIAFKTAAS
jgi:hypothetical protein